MWCTFHANFLLLLIRWIIFCSEWVDGVQSGAHRSLVHSLRNEKTSTYRTTNDEYTFIFILLKHNMTDAKYDLITFFSLSVVSCHFCGWVTCWHMYLVTKVPRPAGVCRRRKIKSFAHIFRCLLHSFLFVSLHFIAWILCAAKSIFSPFFLITFCCVSRWFSVPCYTCHTSNLQINEGFSFQYEIYAIIWD